MTINKLLVGLLTSVTLVMGSAQAAELSMVSGDTGNGLAFLRTQLDKFEAETGKRLVTANLAGPTKVAKGLLGDPIAAKLDDYVEEALADASVAELLDSLKEQPLPPPPAHSSWQGDDDDLILKLFGVL